MKMWHAFPNIATSYRNAFPNILVKTCSKGAFPKHAFPNMLFQTCFSKPSLNMLFQTCRRCCLPKSKWFKHAFSNIFEPLVGKQCSATQYPHSLRNSSFMFLASSLVKASFSKAALISRMTSWYWGHLAAETSTMRCFFSPGYLPVR